MNGDWTRTREEFRRLAARAGISRMAARIPADRTTLYRILTGKTGTPSRAIRASIERILDETKTNKEQP